jgi:hypothetical protein
MDELNIDELKIINRLKDSLSESLNEKIEYNVSRKINSIKNWIGGMIAAMAVSIVIAAFFIGGLVNKVNNFIYTQERANDEFRKAMSVLPEFDKEMALTDKNIKIIANEIAKISLEFNQEIITRGGINELKTQ